MSNRVIYDNPSTEGAGDGYKLERVSAPPVGGTCFQNMPNVQSLQSCCDMNPQAGLHKAYTQRIIAMGKVRAEQRERGEEPEAAETIHDITMPVLPQPHKPQAHRPKVKAQAVFTRGMTVIDSKEGRKGIIIHANAGYTKKSHTPVHKLCSKNGKVWLAKQSDLREV